MNFGADMYINWGGSPEALLMRLNEHSKCNNVDLKNKEISNFEGIAFALRKNPDFAWQNVLKPKSDPALLFPIVIEVEGESEDAEASKLIAKRIGEFIESLNEGGIEAEIYWDEHHMEPFSDKKNPVPKRKP